MSEQANGLLVPITEEALIVDSTCGWKFARWRN